MSTPCNRIIGALISVLIFGISCKKTRTELVTLHTWKVSNAFTNGIKDSIDYKNYRLTFEDNGEFIEIDADSSLVKGDWSINRDRSIITLSQSNGSLTDLNIVTISEDEFHYNIVSSIYIERVLVPAD